MFLFWYYFGTVGGGGGGSGKKKDADKGGGKKDDGKKADKILAPPHIPSLHPSFGIHMAARDGDVVVLESLLQNICRATQRTVLSVVNSRATAVCTIHTHLHMFQFPLCITVSIRGIHHPPIV
jgi:hypothetical protein